jgi:hypothetical protein
MGRPGRRGVRGEHVMPTKYYEIRPPAELSNEDFERLLAHEIFPLVDTQVSRAGGVSGMRLFRSLQGEARYVLGIDFSGVGFLEARTAAAFEAMDTHHLFLDSIN